MKISAQTARKLIKSGKANVIGSMTHNLQQYWVINDNASMRTLHVLIDDAPKLNLTK